MKIKLSKTQWEQIGQKTGWIKKAQAHRLPEDKSKKLQEIFNMIPGKISKDPITNAITSKEIMDEAMGRMYIQAYFREEKDSMAIERYYDSEYLQDQYGKTLYVPINWENTKETANLIISTMEKQKVQ